MLAWMDLEMTGLYPETDRIIEIAVIVTDSQLNVRIEGPTIAVHQSDAALDAMDAWNKGTHGRSGLIDRVKASTFDEAAAEAQVIEFLQRYVPKGKSPMCGNSICQDRRFLARWMPKLESFFLYRNLDVSTLNTTATLPFRVVSLLSGPSLNGTDAGAYNIAVVAFNNAASKNLTGI